MRWPRGAWERAAWGLSSRSPCLWPDEGLIAGFMLAFTRSLGEFGATIMVAGNIEGKTRTDPVGHLYAGKYTGWNGRNVAPGGPVDLAGLYRPGGQHLAGTEAGPDVRS